MRFLGCLACAFVLGALAASPAAAAFPGRDGLLAVQPLSGPNVRPGVVLVDAHGGHERRICAGLLDCDSVPRWSPDGHALAIGGPQAQLIYADGSCLDCQLGSARTLSFTANPALVTLVSHGQLVEDGIDGIPQPPILGSGLSDAVWSAGGKLAAVRSGRVWAGIPHHLRLVGPGSAPSWSPDGSRIALERRGWIVVIGVTRHSLRRVAPGSAPAWSPDGRSIAYIGPYHGLRIVPAAGGRSHPVGHVRGVAVDWQPLPRHPAPGCVAPPGSSVLASSATGVVSGEEVGGASAYMGCLRADGRERLLEHFDDNEDNAASAGPAAVGGDYAALANFSYDPHYGGSSDEVEVFDLRTGDPVPGRGDESVGCSIDDYGCADGIDELVVGAGGVSAADLTTSLPPGSLSTPLSEISCPSTALCAAVDSQGRIVTSTDPTGGSAAWSIADAGRVLTDISCPSASFCAGIAGLYLYTSTDPTGGAGAWTATDIDAGTGHLLEAISCASAALCVATDDTGHVLTSTDPTGGSGAWTAAEVNATGALGAISCPSPSLCVAFNGSGDAVVSTNPTAGAGAWQSYPVTGHGGGPASVSCASPSLCVAVDGVGNEFTSTDPSSATPFSWSPVALPGQARAVSCPSTSLCLAVGNDGTLDVSTDPASGAWTSTVIDGQHDLGAVACATISLCVAGDTDGNVAVSTDPTAGPTAWSSAFVDGNPCSDGTSCTTEEIAASDSTGVHTLDTFTGPGMGSFLSGLSLSGTTLTWDHAGTPHSAVLHP
jgi:hypothetical protein